jgi:hypothetical protein
LSWFKTPLWQTNIKTQESGVERIKMTIIKGKRKGNSKDTRKSITVISLYPANLI